MIFHCMSGALANTIWPLLGLHFESVTPGKVLAALRTQLNTTLVDGLKRAESMLAAFDARKSHHIRPLVFGRGK